MKRGRFFLCLIGLTVFLIPQAGYTQSQLPVSENTEACLECTPQGIRSGSDLFVKTHL